MVGTVQSLKSGNATALLELIDEVWIGATGATLEIYDKKVLWYFPNFILHILETSIHQTNTTSSASRQLGKENNSLNSCQSKFCMGY